MKTLSKVETAALLLATAAHGSQLRKYTFEPYITHPIGVRGLLYRFLPEHPELEYMGAVALLHDTIEDTALTYEMLVKEMGVKIANGVMLLTDPITVPGGPNRAARKAATNARLAEASAEIQNIKIADLMHNAASIKVHDKNFWKVFKREKDTLLSVLTKADPKLIEAAKGMLS